MPWEIIDVGTTIDRMHQNLDVIQRCANHGISSLDRYDQDRLLATIKPGWPPDLKERASTGYTSALDAAIIQLDCQVLVAILI